MNAIRMVDGLGADVVWPFASSSSATVKDLETAFRASLGLSGRLSDHKASLSATNRFTPSGVDAEAAKFVKREVLPSVAKGHITLDRAKRHVKESWSRLTPKAPDKIDPVKRAHIYEKLSSLPAERRNAYLTKFASELDHDILFVALEIPSFPWEAAEQHFIAPATREALTRRLVAAEHGDAIEELETVEQAIAYSEATIKGAGAELQSTLAMNPLQWQAAVQAEARKNPPAWLKRQGAQIVTIVEGALNPLTGKPGLTARTPTPEQLETGVYFDSEDQWRAAIVAA